MEKMLFFFGNVPNELWKTYAPTHLRNELLNTTTSSRETMCFLNFARPTLYNADIVSCLNSISALILIVFFLVELSINFLCRLGQSPLVYIQTYSVWLVGRSVKKALMKHIYCMVTPQNRIEKNIEKFDSRATAAEARAAKKKNDFLWKLCEIHFLCWFLFTRAILVKARALER